MDLRVARLDGPAYAAEVLSTQLDRGQRAPLRPAAASTARRCQGRCF